MTTIAAWLWQGLAIALGTAALLRCSRQLNAATRYVIWCMALVAVVGLPFVRLLSGAATVAGIAPASVVPVPLEFSAPPDWMIALAAGVWLGTVLLGLGGLVRGLAAMSALKRRCAPLDPSSLLAVRINRALAGAARRGALCVSAEVDGACALGLFGRPLIVLSPQLVRVLDAESLLQIVLHEQAHLSRYDDWARLLQAVIHAVFGLHPAVHLINARIDLEREVTCDDAVVAATGAARRYAHSLAEAADALAAPRALRLAPAIVPHAADAGTLVNRIQRLLNPRRPGRVTLQLSAAAGVLSALGVATAAASHAPLVSIRESVLMWPVVHGRPAPTHSVTLALAEPAWLPLPTVIDSPRPEEPRPEPAALPAVPAAVSSAIAEDPVEAIALAVVPPPPPATLTFASPEPALLESTPLLPVARVASTEIADTMESTWRFAADAGGAIGRGVGRAGAATGISAGRAGTAIGVFFGRAGKAVAGSF